MAKLPNIAVRAIAGLVFISILLFGILFNAYAYIIIFGLFTLLSAYEFYGLIEKHAKVPLAKTFDTIIALVLFLSSSLYFSNICGSFLIFLPYLILLQIFFISELFLKRKNAIASMAYFSLGQLYIALPFALSAFLVFGVAHSFTPIYLLAVFVLIWVNDTFAYLTGMTIGKHKLFERISPKKTWEGFIGGIVFSMIASYLFYYFSGLHNLYIWFGFAIITSVIGTLGDLIESLIKRTLEVKDSGHIIPGHGGILDRLDSTILAIPAMVIFLALVNQF